MRVVIVDDEPNARQVVRNILEQYSKTVEVVGEANNVKEGVKILNELKPDLALLDIRMPDGTGFDILKNVEKLDFHFVFVTAYEEYAIKAIKQSALDYILKPINTNELLAAVEKAELAKPQENELTNKLNTLNDNQNLKPEDRKLVLNTQESIHYIKVSDIISCTADKNYTEINIIDSRKLVISKTLKDVEEMLSGCGFFRSHQSHLINLQYISHYEKGLGGTIIMTDKSRIPVSSRKKELFIQLMSK